MFGITAVGVATTGYFLSLGSVGLFVLSAIALRLALTDYKLPVLIILIAALIAFVALLLSIGALVFGQISQLNLPRTIMALVLSAAIFVPVFLAGRALEGIPMINDIMTDTDNPPQFEVVPTQRKAFDNSLELSENRLAFHQKHYGDMKPLIVDGAPDAHFDKVVALVQARGWKIVAQDKGDQGRWLEATDNGRCCSALKMMWSFADKYCADQPGKTRIDIDIHCFDHFPNVTGLAARALGFPRQRKATTPCGRIEAFLRHDLKNAH